MVTHGTSDQFEDETKLVEAPSLPRQDGAHEDVQIPDSGKLGRFVVIEEAGSGGMGKVFRAYDPQLCREVALKVLRQRAGDEAGRVRMLREAQGMARISHPNVLPVYDVEPHGDALFIVLEYVKGRTLREHVADERPDWRKVVELYVEAGRGLDAAHQMDIIHRDFKPANVLVGIDGRVRVMDFGLARSASGDGPVADQVDLRSTDALRADDRESSTTNEMLLLSSPVTEHGMTMGTPAYMAPEQHAGAALDPRCDQFSFCVGLYEALYGHRPYLAKRGRKLSWAKRTGEIRTPPADRSVPRWLHQAVIRGLSPRPDDRWPSMAALADALETGLRPAKMRRAWGVMGLMGLFAGGAFALLDDGSDPCEFESRVDEIWDQERSAAIGAAFEDTGLSYAADSWSRVRTDLDAYLKTWLVHRREVCEEGAAGPSSRRSALEETCLDDRLSEASALLEVLQAADGDVVEGSVRAVASLRPTEPCMDERAMALALPDPDPEQRDVVEQLRQRLHRVRALGKAGKFGDALALAEPLAEEAAATEYLPLVAEVNSIVGAYLDRMGELERAEERLSSAYFDALSSSSGRIAYRTAAALTALVGTGLARPDEGLAWARHARGQLTGLPPGAIDPSEIETAVGDVLRERGDSGQARVHFENALSLVEEDRPLDHPDVAAAMTNVGTINALDGDYEVAVEYLRRALAVRRRSLGGDHPDVAATLNNLGFTYDNRGDWQKATESFEEAGRIFAAAFGPGHETAGQIELNLAVLHHRQDHFDEAERRYERAIEIYAKTYGPDHPRSAGTRLNLGTLYLSLERHDDAIRVITAAVESFRRTYGDEHPLIADGLGNLAEAYRALGRTEEAMAAARKALAMRQKLFDSDHPDLAWSHSTLASLAADQRDWSAARTHSEEALRIRSEHLPAEHPDLLKSVASLGGTLLELDEAAVAISLLEERLAAAAVAPASTPWGPLRFALARALFTDEARRSEAKQLAKQALEDLREQDPDDARVAEVRQWIAAHP